jgi:hypothetical protein
LNAVARELVKYNLDLVAVQEVRWDNGGSEAADDDILLYGNGYANLHLCTSLLIHHGIRTAVKRVKFISDRMSYIILRGEWCDVIVLNVHPPSQDKSDFMKNRLYKELSCVLDQSLRYHIKMLLRDSSAKVRREDVIKATVGNVILQEIMIMG